MSFLWWILNQKANVCINLLTYVLRGTMVLLEAGHTSIVIARVSPVLYVVIA